MFFLVPLAQLLSPALPRKLKAALQAKTELSFPRLNSRPVWIHASSGEIEYAKPLVRELKKRFPQLSLVISYSSPSFLNLKQGLESCDFVFPLPFDQPQDVQKVIKALQPCVVLFSRTDVWPELAYQLRKAGIPSALFAATISPQSTRAQGLGKFLTRFALNQLSAIFCVSEEDKHTFTKMGVKSPLVVQGDTRYDQVLFRLRSQTTFPLELQQKLRSQFPREKTLVLGSTWPEDESVLFDSAGPWLETNGYILWCPHEVNAHHLDQLKEKFSERNWTFTTWSQWASQESEASPTPQIILVDQIGILSQLYTFGKWAFVGGSFKEKVHSVMEALGADAVVLTGPFISNNREAVEFSRISVNDHLFAVNSVNSANEFQRILAETRPTKSPAALVQKRAGATIHLVEWVEATVQMQIEEIRRQ
ncbi:MAG: hypothetical protein LW875_07540 [Proteobacteria bacterium]|jgi:3-deoxy-D-manno-octulosonic-acid transferase|nr:hypothetical protein [Pseudomonadota bacterium]